MDTSLEHVLSEQLKSDDQGATLEDLKAIASSLVKLFGPHACEVVIHDLADLDHSIVWIEGNVTNRQVGGPMTDQGLAMVRLGQYENLANYLTYTDDGRTLKSASIFIRDSDGRTWGAFCINVDITPYLTITHHLNAGILRSEAAEVNEAFASGAEDTVGNMLAEVLFEYGKPSYALTRFDRLTLIEILDRKGAFQIKRAVPIIAKKLGVSRYTIYNYLNEVRDKTAE
jgi:predicted transcriptional regulator YheO